VYSSLPSFDGPKPSAPVQRRQAPPPLFPWLRKDLRPPPPPWTSSDWSCTRSSLNSSVGEVFFDFRRLVRQGLLFKNLIFLFSLRMIPSSPRICSSSYLALEMNTFPTEYGAPPFLQDRHGIPSSPFHLLQDKNLRNRTHFPFVNTPLEDRRRAAAKNRG